MSPDSFRALALSFENVIETPNANKNSFKVDDKIFITIDNINLKAVFRLSPKDQSKFSDLDPSAIYPAQAGWGKQGWTIFELKFIEEELLEKALVLAYCTVAPEDMVKKYKKKTVKK
ncbi:MmcQ/YjbR family DNA-binding protein [Pedobacter sandarakinus]|uniref:MmcQ/YjbR family DNA-binding protein n=1 Tax=Pedobacter sandarakinus TaxID=353156 RepID=UPI0022459DD4|nr:MmcQ/YjbR family DNA-binding protein [Pedobacter sandarakinus]MCX2574399.1 MmcQ/YjbR family DNA-binding protein [Pedobacter sandarakinus]